MALLSPSPGTSLLAGREAPARIIPRIRTRNVRFSVCSGVKDLEKEVLKKGYNNFDDAVRWLYEQVKQSETTPFPSSKTKDEEGKKQDYYVNTGYAIRTIREEFPELFCRELSFDIYRDDIVFKDPVNSFSGIENYKSIFWALRFHGRIFFKALWVDIISVWQPAENMVIVRWTVHGIPRIPFPWESRSRFDGTSEYKLDKNGKIYEHKVHNIALNGPQKFQVLAVEQLIQLIGCPSTPKPTYFEFSSSLIMNILPLAKLSAVKRYLASVLTRPLR
ncbi:hypothetical protein CDL12_26844 [Handroanthus impetiginosus]|uniref:NTF2-like domain-containing protein n=1 Tax=Handroanthus impetiginosus TaxID=429701 RepID=A0A2G9G5R8_9LAMI|nr:hypothetical protein CDL12_26844 [Handroanthus impetiginosus]